MNDIYWSNIKENSLILAFKIAEIEFFFDISSKKETMKINLLKKCSNKL